MTEGREAPENPLAPLLAELRDLAAEAPRLESPGALDDPLMRDGVRHRLVRMERAAAALPAVVPARFPRLPWHRLRALQDLLARYRDAPSAGLATFLVDHLPEALREMEGLSRGLAAAVEGGGAAGFRSLRLHPGRVAVVHLSAEEPLPTWLPSAEAPGEPLWALLRTPGGLTLYLPDTRVPNAVQAERGFRVLELEGPLPFDAVGVLADLTAPLARGGIPLLALSSHDTDLILVREERLEEVVALLEGSGFGVHPLPPPEL